MSYLKKPLSGLIVAFIMTINSPSLYAANNTIELPEETAKFIPSHLSGYLLALQKCTLCHSPDYIMYQPPSLNLAQWTGEVFKMKHTYGAPISGLEVRSIAAYLAVVYGSAQASDPDVIAASTAKKIVPGTNLDATLDVQLLLTNNACFACHTIDTKVVGPAFQAISEKYKDDPNAIGKIADSIQTGGQGKWGEIAMPAMSSLTNIQAEALAEFILKQ